MFGPMGDPRTVITSAFPMPRFLRSLLLGASGEKQTILPLFFFFFSFPFFLLSFSFFGILFSYVSLILFSLSLSSQVST